MFEGVHEAASKRPLERRLIRVVLARAELRPFDEHAQPFEEFGSARREIAPSAHRSSNRRNLESAREFPE
jgi:hypothetical protein